MTLAFVVKPLAVLVHDNAVVVAPDDCVGLRGPRIDKFAVHTIEGACCACTDFQAHSQTCSLVVLEAWCNERELVGVPADISRQHLLIA